MPRRCFAARVVGPAEVACEFFQPLIASSELINSPPRTPHGLLSSMHALERTLYRSVLRCAKKLEPTVARGALTASPAAYYDRRKREVVDFPDPERGDDDCARRADDLVAVRAKTRPESSDLTRAPLGSSVDGSRRARLISLKRRVNGSRRRRGCHVDRPRTGRGDAAAAARIVDGARILP